MKTQYIKTIGAILIVGAFIFLAFGSGDSDSAQKKETTSNEKFSTTDLLPGKTFEFHESSMFTECIDPTIRKITVIDDKTAKIYLWYKGCPNNRIEEDELIYGYKIDEGKKCKQDDDLLKTDAKVLILENENAGNNNGHSHLEKRYMISNTYIDKEFSGIRIFEQLDIQEYPDREGVFVWVGSISK